jgi:phospholipid/cholesterol/gamma-HCH transport system ATP-binding protein
MASGLVVRDASLRFGELTVLSRFDLRLERGSSLVVTGTNGSGKSTLLQVCAGLLPPTTGLVLLDGQRPDPARPSTLFRAGVRRGFVFDNGGLLANHSALANVSLPLRYHADLFGIDEETAEQRAREALEEMGVYAADFHTLPAHLSLGLRRRVSVARALAIRPNFVFFDDPFVGLDAETQALLHGILKRFRDDPEVVMMISAGDLRLIEDLALPVFQLQNTWLMERVALPGVQASTPSE